MSEKAQYDVIITGAGLAGLTLARQLLMYTDRTVLLLDKR
jgi:flavin-dependent dehydrogenase